MVGDGLVGPQQVTLASGVPYKVYSFSDIAAGQTFKVTFSGKPISGSLPQARNQTLPLALGGGLLGLVMAGVGVWWGLKPGEDADEEDVKEGNQGESTLDDLLTQIGQLDASFEHGEMDEEKYRRERGRLRAQAKAMLDKREQLKASLVE